MGGKSMIKAKQTLPQPPDADLMQLADKIVAVIEEGKQQLAININRTIKTTYWNVGRHIVEFEQHGEDRAKYGDNLLKKLAKRLNRRGLGERRLYEYRLTYQVYPQLGRLVAGYVVKNGQNEILRLPTAISMDGTVEDEILRLPTAISVAPKEAWQTPAESLFSKLSATHLVYLSNIDNDLKRAFYEQESIRGCWTVKELDRQVSSQYYERMGMSKDKKALHQLAVKGSQKLSPHDIIHDPVTLEFLGLKSQDAYTETKLETAILNHLQMFLLEMGRGFCFEARQKRILVDQDYFKADLIFYHRILKCHVIIDLKIDRFRHEYASQLNLYLNYYKHEVMQEDDNPPIGLLLCTDYGETTVRYATEGLSDNLFVSKYRLQLPTEEEIRNYLGENFTNEDFEELKGNNRNIR